MTRKLTRRKFLEAGLKGSIVVGGSTVAGLAGSGHGTEPQQKSPSSDFDARERELLRAAMDEIIPASDGMPAASQAGCVEYLDRLVRRSATIKEELRRSLAALEAASAERFRRSFLRLSRRQRVEVLTALETRAAPDSFDVLRDYIYEAYYTRPRVWKLIGYEFYPTNESGPGMKPFDEAVLAQVRNKPTFYRKVP